MKKTAKKAVKKVVKRARKKVGAVIGLACGDDFDEKLNPCRIPELKESELNPYRRFMENPEKVIKDVKNVMDIQGSNGNWNANEYNLGMFNGMEMIISIFEGREPKYRELQRGETTKAINSPKDQVERLIDSFTPGELPQVMALTIDTVRLARRTRVHLGWIGLVGLLACGALLRVGAVFPGIPTTPTAAISKPRRTV